MKNYPKLKIRQNMRATCLFNIILQHCVEAFPKIA